jgi:hypothetical protein
MSKEHLKQTVVGLSIGDFRFTLRRPLAAKTTAGLTSLQLKRRNLHRVNVSCVTTVVEKQQISIVKNFQV